MSAMTMTINATGTKRKMQPIQVSALFSICSTAAHHYKRQRMLNKIRDISVLTEDDIPVVSVALEDGTIEDWEWTVNPNHGEDNPDTGRIDDRYKVWMLVCSEKEN